VPSTGERGVEGVRAARRARRVVGVVLVAAASALLAAACGSSTPDDATKATTTSSRATETSASSGTTAPRGSLPASTEATTDPDQVTALELDPTRSYGNEYADGILPVGDGKVVTAGPERGSIYLCRTGGGGGGAFQRGPWFLNDDTEYDVNRKAHVQGEVEWDGQYVMSNDGTTRRITTNDVPNDHTTGVFPVAPGDPAYQYDRNPNAIQEQQLVYLLPGTPKLGSQPSCMGGEAGVMNTGVALFNGFDAGNRDAGAWEVQDGCDGHPQITGEYHYHTLSSCIDDVSVRTVIGFALDGFPITGPTVGGDNVLTTKDLDECHGITSEVDLDGRAVRTYHYVMTQDFPYSVSCFRGTPTAAPGLPGGGGAPGGGPPGGGPPG